MHFNKIRLKIYSNIIVVIFIIIKGYIFRQEDRIWHHVGIVNTGIQILMMGEERECVRQIINMINLLVCGLVGTMKRGKDILILLTTKEEKTAI